MNSRPRSAFRHMAGSRALASLLSLVILAMMAACKAPPPPVEEIVARSAEAMGDSVHLATLRTIRFEIRSQGRDQPTEWEIIRPNLVRKVRQGEWSLLFDGERAGYLEGPVQEDGSLGGPHLVPEEDWHHFEMDIGIYIPAYFDYPAEYLGPTLVDGAPTHLLQVTLPLGGLVVYAVDAESFLPVRVDLPAWDYSQRLGDFQEVGGILLPHRFWSPSDETQVTVLENVEVNGELDRNLFAFPADVR